MSKTKWIILVIIVLAIWLLLKNNILPGYLQSAAVVNSGNPAVTLDQINRESANIDAKVAANIQELNALGNASSPAQVLAVANRLNAVVSLVSRLREELAAAVANKTSASQKATLADLGNQFTNASSQVGAVINNVKNIQGNATLGTNIGLKQAVVQLRIAHGYLQLIKNDVSVITAAAK